MIAAARALWASPRRNVALLAAVALLFAASQLWFMGLHYGYGWDEGIYISMADPAVPDFAWSPWRAWGVPVLLWPISLGHPSLGMVRAYLVLLSSAGLFLAYRQWLLVRDSAVVPVAALLFSTTFVTVYFGPQAMPNLYVALGALTATALAVRVARARVVTPAGIGSVPGPSEGTASHRVGAPALLGLAASVAFVALVRPSDSLWLVGALVVVAAVWRGARRWPLLVVLAVGEVAGWLPWIVEAYTRFGGPVHRWELSRAAVGGTLHIDPSTVLLYLRMSGATQLMCYCRDTPAVAGPINPAAVLWWLAVTGCVVIAAVTWRRSSAATTLIAAAVAVSLAFSYLFLLEYAIMRFLLPAAALAALAVAEGLAQLRRGMSWALAAVAAQFRGARAGGGSGPGRVRGWSGRLGALAVAALLIVHIGLQDNVLRRRMPLDRRVHAAQMRLAEQLRGLGLRPGCLLVGEPSPMLVDYLACDWQAPPRAQFLTSVPAGVGQAIAAGRQVAIVTRARVPRDSYLGTWREVPIDIEVQPGWRVYLPPEGANRKGARP